MTSGGGDTKEAIRITLAIAESHVKIVVVEKCLSSCANNLFVAGHKREIRGGIVGEQERFAGVLISRSCAPRSSSPACARADANRLAYYGFRRRDGLRRSRACLSFA